MHARDQAYLGHKDIRHTVRYTELSPTLVGALGPAVVMSGVADSGRKSGHGNIDANDPERNSGNPLQAG